MRKFIAGLVLLLGMTVMMGFSSHTDPPKNSKAIVMSDHSQLEVQTVFSDFSFDVKMIQFDDESGGSQFVNSDNKSKQSLIAENEILKRELIKSNQKIITLNRRNSVLQYQLNNLRKPRDGISCN